MAAAEDLSDPTLVLLADDDRGLLEAMAGLFGAQPSFRVIASVGSGYAVPAAVDEFAPHVVVLDVRMPGSGPGLVKAVADAGVAVVCYSADGQARPAMLAAGASAFVLKGDSVSDLVAAVAAARGRMTGRVEER